MGSDCPTEDPIENFWPKLYSQVFKMTVRLEAVGKPFLNAARGTILADISVQSWAPIYFEYFEQKLPSERNVSRIPGRC